MNVSMSQARRIIAVSAMATFGVGVAANVQKTGGLPSARFIVGYGMAFTIVSVMADLGSPAGAGFALLILITALLTQGEDAIALLGLSLGDFQKSQSQPQAGGKKRPRQRKRRR